MFSTNLFFVDGKTKTMIADISDLGPRAEIFGRLYQDACDAGFKLLSEKTGMVTTWHYVGDLLDREGEVQGWKFAVTGESARKFPNLADWVVTVFND